MDFGKIGGRRFFMAMGAGLVNTALLVLGYIDQSIYRDLTLGIVAVYVAGNTTQKIKGPAE